MRPRKELEKMEFDGWDLLDEMIPYATEEYAAWRLSMDINTLAKRIKERTGLNYSEYKDKRREGLKIDLFIKQHEVAMRGNCTMLIWLGKQNGQADQVKNTHESETIEQFLTKLQGARDGRKEGA